MYVMYVGMSIGMGRGQGMGSRVLRTAPYIGVCYMCLLIIIYFIYLFI